MANAGGEKNASAADEPQKQKAALTEKPVLATQPTVAEKAKITAKRTVPVSPELKPVPTQADQTPNLRGKPQQNASTADLAHQKSANSQAAKKQESKPQKTPVRGGQGAAGVKSAADAAKKNAIPRPEAWEDDISRNTLDDLPFTSLPSPASRDANDFENATRYQVVKSYLKGTPIQQFLEKDTWPIPTPEDREGYSAGFDENYWISGLEDYLKIMAIADRLNVVPKSVMDFGCATGRVVRHFAAQSKVPEVWATDINQRHVRWLYEHLPMNVKPVFNHCIPTLPIADKSVDIITAFSVFTHIDTFETHWLAELSRIMSDDGMCYLTVHNEDTWDALRAEKDNEKNRLIRSLVKIDPQFLDHLMGPMPDQRSIYRFTESGPYRAQVFHSNNYLRKVWGRFFDIEAIMPCHHVRQTVVVLKKKTRS